MNIERINDYIDAYSRAINITPEVTSILKELIPNLVKKYSTTITSIPVEQDSYDKYVIKPVDGKYSMEDFFLNRLFILEIIISPLETITNKIGFKSYLFFFKFIHIKINSFLQLFFEVMFTFKSKCFLCFTNIRNGVSNITITHRFINWVEVTIHYFTNNFK